MYEFLNPFWFFLITLPFIFYLIYQRKDAVLVWYLLIGFILRCMFMMFDLNDVMTVDYYSPDSERFHRTAMQNQYFRENNVFTNYTVILSFIYGISNSSRMLGQYFNVILGMGVLAYTVECMKQLGIEKKTMHRVLLIGVLMPQLNFLCASLLREAWCQLFLIISLYYFIRWYKGRGQGSMLFSLVFVIVAAWMHSGCIAIALGYALAFLFYNPQKRTNSISFRTVIAAIALFVVFIMITVNLDTLGSKFTAYSDMEAEDVFLTRLNTRKEAGSQYLMWLPQTSNPYIGLLYSPLKIFYFLFSPIPFDWRGFGDVSAFFMDSIVYLYLLYKIITLKARLRWERLLKRYLIISYLSLSFMFSFGTNVAGTAIRHRAKGVAVLLVTYALCKNSKTNYEMRTKFKSNKN